MSIIRKFQFIFRFSNSCRLNFFSTSVSVVQEQSDSSLLFVGNMPLNPPNPLLSKGGWGDFMPLRVSGSVQAWLLLRQLNIAMPSLVIIWIDV